MRIFGRRKKKPVSSQRPGQPAQRRQEQRPVEERPAERKAAEKKPVSEEMQHAEAMAINLVKLPKFVAVCKQFGFSDPKKAFLEFYRAVKDEKMLWKAEAKAEENSEKKFSRASFYGKLFIKCRGNPENLIAALMT